MKKLSIKMKVTIWYTGLIVIILALVLAFIAVSSDKILLFNMENQLKETVEESVEDLSENESHQISGNDRHKEKDEDFEFHDDGVNLLIYDEEGNILAGNYTEFDTSTPFVPGKIRTIQNNNTEWLIYDLKYTTDNQQTLWVRGIMTLSQLSRTMNTIMIGTLIAFPFLILLAAFGGYWITKRAFKPIQQIIDSVSDIKEGKDLSKRIHLRGPKDEIHDLADTFDHLFDRLQTSFETEKQFTSDASHELRTPTTVIISQSEYALSQKDNPEETTAALDVILKQSKKMSSLISQLLLLARTDQKKNNLLFEQIDMSELTEIVIEELTPIAKSAAIELKSDVSPQLFIEADQTLMMRMLMNLITNAITYGKKGGFVYIQLYRDNNHIIGTVSDNGIGIQKQHLTKIWDRFYRVNQARTSDTNNNTGLGLSMVKWIVETHNGTISVASEFGKGSTFTFRLPIKRG